jgi:hypothetical protein
MKTVAPTADGKATPEQKKSKIIPFFCKNLLTNGAKCAIIIG